MLSDYPLRHWSLALAPLAAAQSTPTSARHCQCARLARAEQRLIGTATTDPAFGLPATWIEEAQTDAAQMAGYAVVDCSNVVATHLSHLMQLHAAKLLGRVETRQLVEHAIKLAPKLIEDVVPKRLAIAPLQKVLQLPLGSAARVDESGVRDGRRGSGCEVVLLWIRRLSELDQGISFHCG